LQLPIVAPNTWVTNFECDSSPYISEPRLNIETDLCIDTLSSDGATQIIQAIPQTKDFYGWTQFYQSNPDGYLRRVTRTGITSVRVRISDALGNTIDTNGIPVHLGFALRYV
jgi:hypothetical protein